MNDSKPIISLSVSCVYYDTPQETLNETISSLAKAVEWATTYAGLKQCELHLINNNPNHNESFIRIASKYKFPVMDLYIYSGHGNIGYGRANNLAIEKVQSKYHLILNPDVKLATDSILEGIKMLELHADIGMLAPNATNEFDDIEYIAKRKPSPFVILLRALHNEYLNKLFKKRLDNYTYKDKIPTATPFDIELASGCFMLCKTSALKEVKGFSNEFFLYFEDFDLSKKIGLRFRISYLPSMKIQHLGGNTRNKGIRHYYLFIKSALIYFSRY